jgi:hypothetical protein
MGMRAAIPAPCRGEETRAIALHKCADAQMWARHARAGIAGERKSTPLLVAFKAGQH